MRTINLSREYEKQTEIRLQLLEMGYRPLPAAEKQCFLKRWPTRPVDASEVVSWPKLTRRFDDQGTVRSAPAVTTAIQIEGTMLAIDVDVQDSEVANSIEGILWDVLGSDVMTDAPMRDSEGTKYMVLVQTDEPYGWWRTKKYLSPDGKDHAVEVFGGKATRYFSCFGPHTLGGVVEGEYELEKAYRWLEGNNPLTMRPEELPRITKDQVDELLIRIGDRLADTGWEAVQKGGKGEKTETFYDLTEDMTFDVGPGVRLDYWEAVAYCLSTSDARCSGSFLDGQPHKAYDRCRMAVSGSVEGEDLDLQVFDHESWAWHFPEHMKPVTREERHDTVVDLGARLAEIAGIDLSSLGDAMVAPEELEGVEAMLERYVHVAASDTYVDIQAPAAPGTKRTAMLQQHNSPIEYVKVMANGSEQTKFTTDGKVFMAQPGMMKADDVGFDPREAEFFSPTPGRKMLNSYRGLPDLGAADPVWISMLEDHYLPHIAPDEDERTFLLDWLATKYQKPWERNCAVLLFAPGVSGTGRGALFSMLSGVFDPYAIKLSEELLFEKFNGWSGRKLLVMADEVGGGTTYRDRKEDYQRLKDLIDPTNDRAFVRRMREEAIETRVFTSFLFATNRINGVSFDAEDRRIAVITQGASMIGAGPWADTLMEETRAHGWAALSAALAHILRERKVVTKATELAVPPRFAGWHRVAQSTKDDLDDAIEEVVRKHAGKVKLWRVKDLKEEVRMALTGSTKGARGDGVSQRLAGLAERAAGDAAGLWHLGQQRVVIDGVEHRETLAINASPELFIDMPWADRGELLEKGTVRGNVTLLGSALARLKNDT